MGYDAAQESESISRHFADADGLSAKAANSPDVRRKLRNRARLEFDNGGNCKGTIESIAHDMIGSGPRLKMALPDNAEIGSQLERLFADWCDDPAIDYADTLRLMVESEIRDGESFGLLTANEAAEAPCKLQLRVVEAEVCSTSGYDPMDQNAVDGIVYDRKGNPAEYHFLKSHPGDTYQIFSTSDYTVVPASLVCHWFRKSRASQCRGIPRITPGLTLIAGIRSYSRSVLGAARIAAMMAGVMKTNMAPEEGPVTVDAYDVIPLQQDSLTALPAGWDVGQMKAEQPTTSYSEYKNANLTEFGRSIHAPRNRVTGDSSPYNYSSARLDDILFRIAIRCERNRLAIRVLDRVFKAWLRELLSTDELDASTREYLLANFRNLRWKWQYDGFQSIDPVKDATATEIMLRTGMITYADALAECGKDYVEHFEQMAREWELATRLGITHLLWPDRTPAAQMANTIRPRTQTEIDTQLEDEELAARGWGGGYA